MHDKILEDARILVIDDEILAADVLCRILESAGYRHVHRFLDPREAIAAYNQIRPDIVILDWVMPQLSGAAVLQELRAKITPTDYLPIVVLTALPLIDVKQEALESGAADFMNKPYDPAEIVVRVANLLTTRFLHLQLEEQNRLLERRVEERTAELSKTNAALEAQIAEGRKATEELQRAAFEWQQSFDASPDHLCILDGGGKILRANRSMRARFEPTHGSLFGLDYRLCYCGIDTPQAQPPWADVLSNGESVVWEGEVPTLDGWYWIASYPLRDESGAAWGAMLIVRDLTRRKEAETALRAIQEELEERVRRRTEELELANSALATQNIISRRAKEAAVFQAHIIDNISEAVIATDPSGRIVYVNRFAQRLYGWSAEEIVGRDVVETIAPHPSHDDAHRIMDALAGGESWSGEFLVQRRDGSTFVAEITNSPLVDETGKLVAVIGISRDLTQRKETQEVLRASDARFRALVETIPGIVLIKDLEGRFLLLNKRFEEFFHRRVEEIIGKTNAEFLGRDATAYVQRHDREVIERGQPIEFEETVPTPDGPRTFRTTKFPLIDGDGRAYALCGIGIDITVRKQTEKKLRETEARYAAVVANVPGVVYRVVRRADLSVVSRFVSAGCRELLEIEPIDFEQRAELFDDLVHPEDRAGFYRSRQEALVKHEDFNWEGRVKLASGKTKWIAVVARCEGRENGDSVWDGLLIDVTQRKRVEEALREADARYLRISAKVPGMVYQFVERTDGSMGFTYVSAGSRELFAIEPAAIEADANAFIMRIDPRDMENFLRSWGESRETLHDWNWEGRVVRAAGDEIWIRGSSRPERQANGDVRWDGVLLDISAQKRAMEQLERTARENSQLASAIANLTSGVVISDPTLPDNPVIFANAAFYDLTGYSADEVLGRNCRFLQGPATDPATVQEIRDAIAAPREFRAEILNYRKNSSRFWNELTITPVFDRAGALINYVGLQSDVTERRETHMALQVAKAEAERANAAKSEFLSRMSHELRTPLNAILGFAELAALDADTADERENVDQIQNAGAHLLQLVNEILDLSSIEAGRTVLSLEPVSLRLALHAALAVVRPLAARREIQMPEVSCDLYVLADEQRFHQVLLNVFSNAVKYNTRGGSVSLRCERTPRAAVRIEVTDTGVGIAAADLTKLFQPFQRLHSKTHQIEGIGLGLAISQRFVEAMGGSIGIVSEEGVGTMVWVELPAAERVSDEREEHVGRAEITEQHAESSSPKTLLYIEDNVSNVRLVERVVAHRPNVRMLTAEEGRIGLSLARQHQPDLILLDLNLPDMNGDQVLVWLQSDPKTAEIPVVMLSANATGGEIARLKELGARAYITKPFQVPNLLQAIDDGLEGKLAPS